METDPFIQFVMANEKGSLVEGEVLSVDGRGAEIRLVEGVEGFLPQREIGRGQSLRVGDKVEVGIAVVDRKNRTLTLTTKARESHEEQESMVQQYARSAATGTTSLGDLIKEQLKRKQEEEG
jgi:small subunit ribosomal protein S1